MASRVAFSTCMRMRAGNLRGGRERWQRLGQARGGEGARRVGSVGRARGKGPRWGGIGVRGRVGDLVDVGEVEVEVGKVEVGEVEMGDVEVDEVEGINEGGVLGDFEDG